MLTRTCICGLATFAIISGAATAAERLIATQSGPDIDIPGAGFTQPITFSGVTDPVTGIGLTAQWTAVVADNKDGLAPWALDLEVNVTAPGGSPATGLWAPIGGDVTIADYPLQDFQGPTLPSIDGNGEFVWGFDSIGPPWVVGLRDVRYHLTTTVPDVQQIFTGDVAADGKPPNPMWDRPFFIEGISSQGPVVFDAMPFRVDTSGGYSIESIVPTGNNFAYIYEGPFDPDNPLTNLLDYGLGNGFAPNGSPQGTSLIDVMLFEHVNYTLVVSQWTFFTRGQNFTNTITGPGTFIAPCPADCAVGPGPGGLFAAAGNGAVNVDDLFAVVNALTTQDQRCDIAPNNGDGTFGNGVINFDDLVAVINAFGACPD